MYMTDLSEVSQIFIVVRKLNDALGLKCIFAIAMPVYAVQSRCLYVRALPVVHEVPRCTCSVATCMWYWVVNVAIYCCACNIK